MICSNISFKKNPSIFRLKFTAAPLYSYSVLFIYDNQPLVHKMIQ